MRPELTATRSLLALALAIAGVATACSSSITCGEGTVEKDGACVVVPGVTCGEGTVASGGACVPVGGDVDGGTTSATCDPACGPGELCDGSGVCIPAPRPATWTCAPSRFRDGEICDCACGAPDPDCSASGAPVTGCLSGACQADGTCAACTPKCSGKSCGPDGCGALCGQCFDPSKLFCLEGKCAACTPDCGGKTCGPDGCGGTCGDCGSRLLCTLGKCAAPPPEASCSGRCGGVAPSGCSCTGGCDRLGTCCVDVDLCGCLPSCGSRTCGDDGCGGVCGTCPADKLCFEGACAANTCQPDPCNGHGTCHFPGASCTCEAGFGGAKCSECAQGFTGYPICVPRR